MKRRRDLSVHVNLILVSYLFHEQLQKIFEEEFTKCTKHSQLKKDIFPCSSIGKQDKTKSITVNSIKVIASE